MSWLEELERDYKYKCESCGKTHIHTSDQGYPACKEDRPCECGGLAHYDGFLPTMLNLRGKVAFDQNGRKGYQITDGRGGVRYVSATKEHYLETGDIKPTYTKAYAEHLRATGHADQLVETKYKDLIEERKKTQESVKRVKAAKDSMLKEDSSEV